MDSRSAEYLAQGAAPRQRRALSTGLTAVAAAFMLAVIPPAHAAPADDAQVYVDIAAQPLGAALIQLANQFSLSLAYSPDIVAGRNAPPVAGKLTVDQALRRLLAGSGIEFKRDGRNLSLSRGAAAPDATTLSTVTVTAESADARTEGTGSYTTRNVTLGKGETPLLDIPQSVSVVTRQRMDDQNMTTIRDALRQATGITTRINDNPYLNNQYFARGYALSSELDGVPSYGSLNVGAPQFDLAMYDRIEIIRGSAGLLEGSGEPGGLVNFARKRPTADFQASGSISAGSWDFYHSDLDVSGSLNQSQSLRGRAVIAGTDQNHFYGNSNAQSAMLYGIVEYDIDPSTLLSVSGTVQRDVRKGIMSQLPAYSDGSLLDISPKTNPFPDWTRAHQNTEEGFIELNHYFQNDWKARASFRYRHSDNNVKYLGVSSSVDPTDNTASYFPAADKTSFGWAGADVNFSGPFQLFGRTHRLLIGANYDRLDSKDNYSNVDGGTIDFDELVHLPEPALPYTGIYKVRTEQFGVYGQGRFQILDPLTLVVGGRVSNYKEYVGIGDYGTTPDMEKSPGAVSHKFTPYAGLIYKVTPDTSLYASYSDIFVPQSQLSASGSPLPPRSGRQYEAGVKSSLFDGRLNASAAIFKLQDRNRAYYVSDVFYYRAAGRVDMNGFEAEITGSPLPGWDLSAGYTYLDPHYETEQDDLSMITPRHNVKLWSNYRFRQGTALEKFNVGAGILASSPLKNGTADTPGYVTASLQVGYQFNPRTSATLTVDNVLGKTYYQSIGYYGNPRSVMLALRTRF
ncbi:TonB-dependent siderophore receptor [Achromobacter aloeverae]